MMRTLKILALAAGLSLLTGCITFSNLSRESTPRLEETEAVIVLGVSPRFRVPLSLGVRQGDTWTRDKSGIATTNTFPDDGYIVVKVPGNIGQEAYAITGALPEGIGPFVPHYIPCNGQNVFSFQAKPGQVVYVGHIDMSMKNTRMQFAYSLRPDEAKQFMSRYYPRLSDSLEISKTELSVVQNMPCPSKENPVIIPIYVMGR